MSPNWLTLRENNSWKKNFFLRAKILDLIREFFRKDNFLEVETPNLVRVPGMEPHLNPIKVNLPDGKDKFGYLITSPEYAMKKLLSAGFPKIFQICKSFRGGEEADRLHNQEFTILEWYRARADYRDIMADVERLFIYIHKNLLFYNLGKNFIKYQGQIIDLTPPWSRLTIKAAFWKYAKIDLDKTLNRASIARAAKKGGHIVAREDKFDDIFFKIFLSKIEPNLGRKKPTILYDWPAKMAALSRLKKSNPRYAERFEVYIGGLELGNAFSELNDWREQKDRLLKERKLRRELGMENYAIDKDFIEALKVGMPESGGIAMGVDRIVMFFVDSKNIDEVLFFPTKEIFKI